MTTVPFVDLHAQHRSLEKEINAALSRVLSTCDFILGAEVETFEKEFAAFVGAQHGIGVGSGLDALQLSLRAAGIGGGDEVVLPANTFIATALAVSAVGAKPVLVDVDEATFNIDPRLIERALTPRTKAIIPVHLYGQSSDMDEIMAIAKAHGLVIIEDACQSHGATYKGRVTGTMGLTGCYSFYPAKNLGACGDGGMIVTNDAALAAKLRMLRHYGQKDKYHHLVRGTNSRIDTIQAAILRVKLKHLVRWNKLRAQHAERYSRLLAGVDGIRVPAVVADRTHVFHLYVIRVSNRDQVQDRLAGHGIQTGIHYPVPIHLHEAYADIGGKPGDFPVAERLSGEILSLPMFPELTAAQMDRLVTCFSVTAGQTTI
jgi:dTDP-4-amino-4,6-dideoxygalactose transaminase